jgi:hypothetical protein
MRNCNIQGISGFIGNYIVDKKEKIIYNVSAVNSRFKKVTNEVNHVRKPEST